MRPYYLYQCDLVQGSGHFRTTVAAGLEIMENLRGHTSGYAIPTYVVDAPGGGGKLPVMPNYLISQSHDHVVLRNFEGYITSYAQPTDYQRPRRTKFVPEPRKEPGQEGVASLLRGDRLSIKPEHWDETHIRLPEDAISMEDLKKARDVEVPPPDGNGKVWSKLD